MDTSAPVAAWVFEVLGPIAWVVITAYYVAQCRRERKLTVPALVFLGATLMWWQEWYGDWGGYVLYNPHLHLIPGYHLTATGPNKPWAVIPAYGWFFGLVYFPVITLVRWLHGRFGAGRGPYLSWLLGIGLIVFYAWDLLIEGVASVWGLWSYTHYVGPAIVSSRGNFPLVYPIIPFALMMALTTVVIEMRRDDPSRGVRRVVSSAVTMNLCYALLFIGPICLVRWAFLPDSALVP